MLRDAAVAGAGVAWMPDFYITEDLADGRLVAALEDYAAEPIGIWAVMPQHRQVSAKVRAAVDALVAAFATD